MADRLRWVAFTASVAVMAGCTLFPPAPPEGRHRTQILPGSLAARRNLIDVRIAFDGPMAVQAAGAKTAGVKATDVKTVELHVFDERSGDRPGLDPVVYQGSSQWAPERVTTSGDQGWSGMANTFSIYNLPPGRYSVSGIAKDGAGNNLTKGGYGSSRTSASGKYVTIDGAGNVSYDGGAIRLQLQLALNDAVTGDVLTGISFNDGLDSPISHMDNYTKPVVALGPYAVGTTPNAIAIDKNGNAWVTNQGGNVHKIAPNGAVAGPYAVGTTPKAVAVDKDGNAWVANNGSNNVHKIAPNGTSNNLSKIVP